MRKTILIVDDDIQIGNMEQELLEQEGYTCLRAYSGTETLMLLERTRPDLILLDLMLPGLSGEEIIKRIASVPVIIVSAKASVDDKVSMLMDGASDYITKPFDNKELLARISVQLRRSGGREQLIYRCGDLEVDTISHMASIDGKAVDLTKTEYAILKVLISDPERVFSRSAILDRISEDTPDGTEGSLKIHISHLRNKLREHSDREYIESVWGIGFKMAEYK